VTKLYDSITGAVPDAQSLGRGIRRSGGGGGGRVAQRGGKHRRVDESAGQGGGCVPCSYRSPIRTIVRIFLAGSIPRRLVWVGQEAGPLSGPDAPDLEQSYWDL